MVIKSMAPPTAADAYAIILAVVVCEYEFSSASGELVSLSVVDLDSICEEMDAMR